MKPITYAVYKGVTGNYGAVQFSLKLPTEVGEGEKKESTPGCIFVQAASATKPNVYDWDNKVVFALGLSDIGSLLEFFDTAFAENSKLRLMHDPGMKSDRAGAVKKYLELFSSKGVGSGCIMKVAKDGPDGTTTHSIPLSAIEIAVLRCLLRSSVSTILGWTP